MVSPDEISFSVVGPHTCLHGIGEFHFGALDRGPFCPGLILLKDQAERAETYRRYVRTSLEHPNIVGVHWHQFSDQATAGRFDGENMQVGWTDVSD